MDLGSIFLILALLVLVGLIISRPFFEKGKSSRRAEIDSLEHQRSTLLAERDRILNALQELDFDHALGKIPEEDYPSERAQLLQKGADVLRQLDALEQRSDDGYYTDARLEAAIGTHQGDFTVTEAVGSPGHSTIPDADDEIEVMLANRRRARQEKSAGFCHKCGGPLGISDQFCPKCGTSLK